MVIEVILVIIIQRWMMAQSPVGCSKVRSRNNRGCRRLRLLLLRGEAAHIIHRGRLNGHQIRGRTMIRWGCRRRSGTGLPVPRLGEVLPLFVSDLKRKSSLFALLFSCKLCRQVSLVCQKREKVWGNFCYLCSRYSTILWSKLQQRLLQFLVVLQLSRIYWLHILINAQQSAARTCLWSAKVSNRSCFSFVAVNYFYATLHILSNNKRGSLSLARNLTRITIAIACRPWECWGRFVVAPSRTKRGHNKTSLARDWAVDLSSSLSRASFYIE